MELSIVVGLVAVIAVALRKPVVLVVVVLLVPAVLLGVGQPGRVVLYSAVCCQS